MTIRQKNILSFAIFFSAIFLNATMAKIQLNILKQTDKIHHIAHTLKTTLSECRKHEKNILLFGPYKKATLLGIVEKTYLAKFNDNLDVLEKAAKQGAKISKKRNFPIYQ